MVGGRTTNATHEDGFSSKIFSVDARNGCSRGQHRADAQCASTLMFAALMMGHHFSISAL